MKKNILFKKYIFIFIIFCFLGLINSVSAEEKFKCEYQFGDSGSEIYIFEFDITNGTWENLSEKADSLGDALENTYLYTYSEYNFSEGEIKSYTKNKCPVLFMKRYASDPITSTSPFGTTTYTYSYDYKFFSDSHIREESKCELSVFQNCLDNFFGDTEYLTGTLKKDSEINADNEEVSNCPTYTILIKEIETAYNSYKSCSGNECSKKLTDAKESIDKLRRACREILSYRDVIIENTEDKEEGREPLKDACVDVCLNVEEHLTELKEEAGILSTEIGECGFSERLLSWGLNIMKWVKYIVPVFVIIFGIFDFIKAIGADKEDEMKKAQKKFITRLIAAALIFIIPFIIEFALDKFGFTPEGCGVIAEID